MSAPSWPTTLHRVISLTERDRPRNRYLGATDSEWRTRMTAASDSEVGPFENGFYRRQLRQAWTLVIAVPVLILALLGLVYYSTSSSHTLQSFEIGAVIAVIVVETLLVAVLPRLTFQAKQLWAGPNGLRLRWKYLAGGREALVPWDRLRGVGEETTDRATLLLYWGPFRALSSTILAFDMDGKSFSVLKPLLQAHAGGVRYKS